MANPLTSPGLACFFTFMTVAEGGGKRAVQKKFQDIYVPALKANWLVWPAVQMINFRIMPIQYQIVSSAHPCKYCALTVSTALCFYHWYCLDSIPVPYELCRGCNIVNASRIPNTFAVLQCVQNGHGPGYGTVDYPMKRVCALLLHIRFSELALRYCIASGHLTTSFLEATF